MKKLLAAAMACSMVFGLAACSGGGDDQTAESESAVESSSTSTETSQEANLTFAWWGNQTRNERTQEVLDMYSEENPGITFDSQFSDWGDYWNKLATASAGHNLPDIVQMDYKYIKQYVDNDMLLDLTPYVESGLLDVSNIDQSILKSGSIDGGLYAVARSLPSTSMQQRL